MTTIDDVIHHARNREYMSGVQRDKARVKATADKVKATGESPK